MNAIWALAWVLVELIDERGGGREKVYLVIACFLADVLD